MEDLKEKHVEKARATAIQKVEDAAKAKKAGKMWKGGKTMKEVDEVMTARMEALRAAIRKKKAGKHALLKLASKPELKATEPEEEEEELPASVAKEFEDVEVKAAEVEKEELKVKHEEKAKAKSSEAVKKTGKMWKGGKTM